MKPEKLLYLCAFILLFSSCINQKSQDINSSISTPLPRASFIHLLTDSIPTGVSIPLKGDVIPPESLEPPFLSSLQGNLHQVKAFPHIQALKSPEVVSFQDGLPGFTPSLDSFSSPEVFEAKFKKTIPLFQAPSPPSPMKIKEDIPFDIRSMTTEEGLLSNDIYNVMEDKRGRLWFATNNGISRYDGNEYLHFTLKEGLPGNRINFLFEDSQERIWMGFAENGVCFYDGQTFHQFSNVKELNNSNVWSIAEDSNGDIWIGSYNGGVFKFDGKNLIKHSKESGFPWEGTITMDTDSEGGVWFGDRGALFYDGSNFKWLTEEQGLISNDFGFIHTDRNGEIWLGTTGGVNHYDGQVLTRYTSSMGIQGGPWSIYEDHDQVVWIGGTQNAGLTGIDHQQLIQLTTENGLDQNGTVFLTEDSGNNLWICTLGSGASKLKTNGFFHFSEKNGLSYPSIRSICEDRYGDLWLGTHAKSVGSMGIMKFDGQNFIHIQPQNGLLINSIRDIKEDSNGLFWMSTGDMWEAVGDPNEGGGVLNFDGQFFNIFGSQSGLVSSAVMAITIDNHNNKWFGTRNGITQYDGTTFTHYTTDHGLLKNHTFSATADSKGRVWFGYHEGGASRIDKDSITNYSEKEGLSPFTINALMEDTHGKIWMATNGGGLSIFDGQYFHQITQKDGLQNDFITSILEDEDGNIWIGTNKGLNVLVPEKEEQANFRHPIIGNYRIISLGKKDGLKSTNLLPTSICLDRQNRLWLGASQGLNMLDLNKYKLPDAPPKHLSLNKIDIDQQFVDYRRLEDSTYKNSLSFGETLLSSFDSVASFFNYPLNLNLPYKIDHLTFHFSAIDWSAPHQIKYSFLMEGLDQKWSIPSAQPVADYRNLPHGTYTFKVKAIGIAQLWSEPFEYPFTIRPPWWQMTWAYTIYALLIGLFGYFLYRYLLNRQLELQEAKRLRELDEVKTKLYTNISHEFRTPLTVISGMAQKILENPKKWGMEGGKLITRNSNYLLQLVNQILDLRKLESGSLKVQHIQSDIISYIQYLMQSFHSLADNKDIRLHFYAEEKEIIMDFDPDKIQHIFTNLVSNAIKYTPEGGDVYVRVEKVEGGRARVEGGRARVEGGRAKGEGRGANWKVEGRRANWKGEGRRVNYKRADLPLKSSSRYSGRAGGRGRANLNPEIPIIILKIRDTGVGIPEDQLPHIFDRFYQVDDSSTRKGERLRQKASVFSDGTGIGLALTKELVQLLKGNISVKSQVNEGTEFTIQIPISNEAPLQASIEDQLSGSIAGMAASGADILEQSAVGSESKPLALIVEDNADVATYLFSCLEDRYQLLWAKNGQLGIDKAFESVPDIIISDVMMPEKDGFELCQALKSDVRTSHIPIILLTAKADIDSKLEGLSHGADAYLAKPFNPKELDIRLEKLIELRKKLQDRYQDHAAVKKQPGNLEDEFLSKLNQVIQENISDENFGIQQLCRAIGMSRTQLHRKIKALTDKSTSIYVRSIRLSKAKELLKTTKLNVSEIAYEVGFSNPVYFTQVFSEEFGVPPSEMR